jgi:hypothetical protein
MNLLDLARSALPCPTAPVQDPTGAHYRWRVILADRTPFEVCCLPELTEVEMRERYPGTVLQPLPDAAIEASTGAALADRT